MKAITRFYYCVMYYASWCWFGLVGLGLNLVCAVLLVLPRTQRLQRGVRRVIRSLFDFWVRWFHFSGVLKIRWNGFPEELPDGTVYIANHPSLLDATILLARLPDAFCIFKPALMRNPCIAPAAIMGGYVSGGRYVDTIREAAEKVSEGLSLLVFPEGQRTNPGTTLGSFRPAFALVATRANAPIHTFVIRSSAGMVTRGRPWWMPPPVLPATLEITSDRIWPADQECHPRDLATEIENYLRNRLPDPVV